MQVIGVEHLLHLRVLHLQLLLLLLVLEVHLLLLKLEVLRLEGRMGAATLSGGERGLMGIEAAA